MCRSRNLFYSMMAIVIDKKGYKSFLLCNRYTGRYMCVIIIICLNLFYLFINSPALHHTKCKLITIANVILTYPRMCRMKDTKGHKSLLNTVSMVE